MLATFCFGVVLSATAFAAQSIKLDLGLDINGKKSKAAIITKFNQEASLSSKDDAGNGYRITVFSKPVEADKKHEAVEMAFEIFEIFGNKSTLVASPKVISLMGQKAALETQGEHGKTLSLSVVPTLQ